MVTRFLNYLHDVSFFFLTCLKSIYFLRIRSNSHIKQNLKRERSIIICNGPSLENDLVEINKKKHSADIYALNYFALSPHFRKLKPNRYVFADAMFWRDDVNEDIRIKREKLFLEINKIDWKIIIICPNDAYTLFFNNFRNNKYISVEIINQNFCDFKYENITLFALRYKLMTPSFINVCVVALWHAILNDTKNIELYGADFSFFKTLDVDQKTNEAMIATEYFYEKNNILGSTQKYKNTRTKKIHIRLRQCWLAFQQMYLLSELARKKNLKLINFSSKSFLDSIDRNN